MVYWVKKGGATVVKPSLLLIVLAVCLLLSGCNAPVQEPAPWTMPPNPYEPADFLFAGDRLQANDGKTVMGIDVSSHQGSIDWQQVAASGVEFAFIRLGYRGYESGALNTDRFALANLSGAKAAGLKVGAYFFSQAITVEEAREEATYALDILAGTGLDLPLVYDWEYISETARTAEVDRRTLTDCTAAFCQAAEAAGYNAMIYFNTSQARDMLLLEELESYGWWLAKYDMTMDFICRTDLWQYTDEGSIPGIQGNVDINLMFTGWGIGKQLFGAT